MPRNPNGKKEEDDLIFQFDEDLSEEDDLIELNGSKKELDSDFALQASQEPIEDSFSQVQPDLNTEKLKVTEELRYRATPPIPIPLSPTSAAAKPPKKLDFDVLPHARDFETLKEKEARAKAHLAAEFMAGYYQHAKTSQPQQVQSAPAQTAAAFFQPSRQRAATLAGAITPPGLPKKDEPEVEEVLQFSIEL